MSENRLYTDLAYLWPLVSRPEDYAHEASFWRLVMRDHLGGGRHQILELGVGGGNNLSHLAKEFDATAVDLSPAMLEHSKRLNPHVEHHVGDMRTVRLHRTFDAVLIHDAINYMLSESDLKAAFETAATHLRPGGLFIAAPDYVKETFRDGTLHHHSDADENTKLTFVEYDYDPDPNDTTFESQLIFLIRQRGELRVEQDRHTLGLFPDRKWLEMIKAAGFEVKKHEYPVHEDAREAWLYVGVKD
jgi:SAM-dependent methyltransferase